MTYFTKNLSLFSTIILLLMTALVGQKVFSQEPIIKYTFDSLHFNPQPKIILDKLQAPFDNLVRSSDDQDKKILKTYGYLSRQKPTSKNYHNYYDLACTLWNLNRLKEAEQLFLNIINSSEKHYSTTYHHSSDVPGDTTTNIYGYGSYTSSYKNTADIYLTKIYIVHKQFDVAYKYLQDAVNKYKVTYNCGTGYYAQIKNYNLLSALCFEGQKKYNKVLELLLPACLEGYNPIIVRVIKKKYSPAEIKSQLLKAENSMQCSFDTFPSYSYMTTYNSDNKTEIRDTLTYYSGSATIQLFGTMVNIPAQFLENGVRVTKEWFMKEFKESFFYSTLAEVAGLPDQSSESVSANE